MNLIVFASLIILCSLVARIIKRNTKQSKNVEQSFWEREHKSNSVRRKPLDDLEYITIPLERFPTTLLRENTIVNECIEILETLSGQPIVNLTGYTNTDLKLEYGTANITPLTEYDQNFTALVTTLQKWADILLENNYSSEAETIMEFAIDIRTDVSRTYYRLAELYSIRLETERVHQLVEIAEGLRSANKNTIVRTLQESYL